MNSFARPVLTLAAALSLTAQTPPVAQLGIQFPPLGMLRLYTDEAFGDIRDNLHAGYVRVGWLPGWAKYDKRPWLREDRSMHRLCGSGLKAMIIVPGFRDDRHNTAEHLYANIDEFFTRYEQREPGCIVYAELSNEADIPSNGFANVGEYAQYYRRVAPMVAKHGIKVITSGTSGKDLPWTYSLTSLLAGASLPLDGFGFHPYGVAPANLAASVDAMRQVSGHEIYITEMGEKDADDLYAAIVNLAYKTPALTIFEYERQPGDDPGYALKDSPALYQAVQRAWKRLTRP